LHRPLLSAARGLGRRHRRRSLATRLGGLAHLGGTGALLPGVWVRTLAGARSSTGARSVGGVRALGCLRHFGCVRPLAGVALRARVGVVARLLAGVAL